MSFEEFCETHKCTDEEVIALLCHLMVFRSMRYYQGYVRLKKAPSAQEGR
jgi:NurA-like 5'-3' nuclease